MEQTETTDIYGTRIIEELNFDWPVKDTENTFVLCKITDDVLDAIDRVNHYLDRDRLLSEEDETHNVRPIDVEFLKNEKRDFNIFSPVEDPGTGRTLFVVAQADPEDFEYALPHVVFEASRLRRKLIEEAIVRAAIGDPERFIKAVAEHYFDSGCIQYSRAPKCYSEPEPCGLSDSDESAPKRIERFQYERPRIYSERDKKNAFNRLPQRLSALFEKQNPEDAEIVRETFRNMTASEMRAILFRLARKKKDLLRDMADTALSAASQYELHVRPWSQKCRGDFKDRFRYCLYIRDSRGREKPVVFKNNPSYCIYMMYVIDRARRGEDATELAPTKRHEEFCRLYGTLMCEDSETIESLFKTMTYRNTAEKGKVRKGRFDDYIKDIHETMESLVGEFNSIPLKVGHGRFLEIQPERIFIDQKLAEFDFS